MGVAIWCDTGGDRGHVADGRLAVVINDGGGEFYFCTKHLGDAFSVAINHAEQASACTITVPGYGAFTLATTGARQRHGRAPAAAADRSAGDSPRTGTQARPASKAEPAANYGGRA